MEIGGHEENGCKSAFHGAHSDAMCLSGRDTRLFVPSVVLLDDKIAKYSQKGLKLVTLLGTSYGRGQVDLGFNATTFCSETSLNKTFHIINEI